MIFRGAGAGVLEVQLRRASRAWPSRTPARRSSRATTRRRAALAGRGHDGLGRAAPAAGDPVEARVAALLHREVDPRAVAGPLRRALPVVDRGAQLAPLLPSAFITQTCVSSIVVSDEVRRARGARASRCDAPSGDHAGWYSALFVSGQPADVAAGDVHGEDVVVEDAIRVGFAVRDEEDLVALRRPVQRVVVEGVLRQRPRLVG